MHVDDDRVKILTPRRLRLIYIAYKNSVRNSHRTLFQLETKYFQCIIGLHVVDKVQNFLMLSPAVPVVTSGL